MNVSFIDNTAGQEGGAIYATSLEVCARVRPGHEEEAESLFQFDPFYFRFNSIMLATNILQPLCINHRNNIVTDAGNRTDERMATDPAHLTVSIAKAARPELSSTSQVTAAPGEKLLYIVSAEDQTRNKRRALWSSNITGEVCAIQL